MALTSEHTHIIILMFALGIAADNFVLANISGNTLSLVKQIKREPERKRFFLILFLSFVIQTEAVSYGIRTAKTIQFYNNFNLWLGTTVYIIFIIRSLLFSGFIKRLTFNFGVKDILYLTLESAVILFLTAIFFTSYLHIGRGEIGIFTFPILILITLAGFALGYLQYKNWAKITKLFLTTLMISGIIFSILTLHS